MPIYEYRCDRCGVVMECNLLMDDFGNIHDGRRNMDAVGGTGNPLCGGTLRRGYSPFTFVMR